LAANVEQMNGTALAGYFVLGTNGEYKALSVAERFAVLRTVVQNRARDKVVMAGMGFESTQETIAMTLRAADEGADMVSLLMPHFFAKKMTPDVLAGYVTDVADASPLPVLLYNNPSVAAGVTIRTDLIDLVKDHPNVIGIKDSSSETYRQNLEAAKGRLCVLAGTANYFLDLLKSGGTGGVLSLANVFPDACAKLYALFKAGKTQEAEALNASLIELNHKVSGSFGVAGVKAAMDLAGFCGGVPRKPLLPLAGGQLEELKQSLAKSHFAR
ncbi:MAG: dihydrodipicolinate synthase family protein, partial [Thermodesulfobacteriota bacterium]